MNTDLMKSKITKIMCAKNPYGLTAHACLKHDQKFAIKAFLMNDSLREATVSILSAVVARQYLDDSVELDSSENIADDRKVLYEVLQNDEYNPFAFLNAHTSKELQVFSEDDIGDLIGLAFKVNYNSEYIWLYQQVYQVRLIKRSKSLYAMISNGNQYIPLDRHVLKIDERIDIVIVNESIITSNIGLLQNQFGFDEYIRSEAQNAIRIIDELGIVSDTSKIIDFEEKRSLTNAKKLLKAKHSPVLKMKQSDLIVGLQKHPRYKDKFRFENGKIVISSQKDVGELVKMLNDSIVKSELTGMEYDSINKSMLPPI